MMTEGPESGQADAGRAVQALIAEYNSLRTEIHGRSRDQLICVTGSLVTTGVILSTVAAKPAEYAGLLVVAPWLLAVFGLLWSDHAHAVHLIGKYIREELEAEKFPRVVGGGKTEVVGWESYVQEKRETTKFLGFVNIVLPLFYFVLPAVSLVVAYVLIRQSEGTRLPPALEISFLGIGLFLIVALGVAWKRALRLT